jgi:hypothetical protein
MKQETKMNKFIIAASALVALSAPAFAERSYDLRDSDTYFGKYSQNAAVAVSATESQPLAIEGDSWLQSRFGLTKDPQDVRRWDEKNN